MGGRGDNGNERRSISDGSGLQIGRVVKAEVIAGYTVIGDRGALWTVTEESIKISEEEVSLSDIAGLCTVDAVSVNFEFTPDIGEESKFLFSGVSGDEWIQVYMSVKKFVPYRVDRFRKIHSYFRRIRNRSINFDNFGLIPVHYTTVEVVPRGRFLVPVFSENFSISVGWNFFQSEQQSFRGKV